jgi:hypothetical protein
MKRLTKPVHDRDTEIAQRCTEKGKQLFSVVLNLSPSRSYNPLCSSVRSLCLCGEKAWFAWLLLPVKPIPYFCPA